MATQGSAHLEGMEDTVLMKGQGLRWKPVQAGIEFLDHDGVPIPTFPVAPGSAAGGVPVIRLLEELWGCNLVKQAASTVVLPWPYVYELDKEDRDLLGIPQPDDRFFGKLQTYLWPTKRDFRLWVELHVSDATGYHLLPADQRAGLLFETPQGPALPPRPIGELVLLLDEQLPEAVSDRTLRIAEAKRLARQSKRVALDDFLKKEEHIVPDGISVGVEVTSPEEIKLSPTARGVDESDFPSFSDGPAKSVYTQFLAAGGRRRLVLRQDQREAVRHLQGNAILSGPDVPRFFDNPEAFLPDARRRRPRPLQ